MTLAPHVSLHDDLDIRAVFYALRDLFSEHPELIDNGAESLSGLLWMTRYLPCCPPSYVVEEALGALRLDGEVLS